MKKYMIRLFQKLNLLKFFNMTISISVNERRVLVPVNMGLGTENINTSEIWMLNILKLLNLSNKTVFIDVGVNVGQTLIKVKAINPDIQYVGFEPNSVCVHYVQQLIKVNEWHGSDIVPVGISEDVGIAVLDHYSDNDTDSSASIISDYRSGSKIYKKDIVAILNLENVKSLWHGKQISIVKIDVEGAELGVIKTLKPILVQSRPNLLVEILPVYDYSNKERLLRQVEIEKILKELDYKIYRIHKDNDNRLTNLELLEEFGVHKRLDWCDYIFSPEPLDIYDVQI